MRVPSLISLFVGATFAVPSLSADEKLVYSPSEKVEGKTLQQWATAYFQCGFPIKKSRNPVTDTTGKFAGENQKGPVWFLAGSLGGVPERTVTVPAGKPIVSPVLYAFTSDFDGPLGSKDVISLKDRANRFVKMSVRLDGKDIGGLDRHRVTVPQTKLKCPESPADTILPPLAGSHVLIADGYWFILKPLLPGDHLLRIKGRIPGRTAKDPDYFSLDLKYKLKVVKK